MIASAIIAILCLIGIYVSVAMLRKQIRAQRGELTEPSVVETPRATLTGVPNSALGLVFYLFLLALTPFLSGSIVWTIALVATLLAAAMSVYLAYSLLFVTRMPCVNCWTGHVVNWLLLLVLVVFR